MGKYNFQQDSRREENSIQDNLIPMLKYLRDMEKLDFDAIEVMKGYCSSYDVRLIKNDKTLLTVEYKEDFYSKKSDNIAVEFHCRGKASGLAVTKADLWVYRIHLHPKHLPNKILWCVHDTQLLTTFIEENDFRVVINGGDEGSNTHMHIIPLSKFKESARLHIFEELP